MRAVRWVIAVLFFIWIAVPGASLVRAQAVQETAGAVDPAVLKTTTEQYFSQVERYRNSASQYQIAQQTYYQLNTLAAQDEAIRRGKDVLLARADLLSTYFTYLHLSVLQVRGAELTDKQQTLNLISSILSELAVYKNQIPGLSTRADVNTHFVQFNSRKGGLLTGAYASLELIKIGQIQTAIDTASLLRQDMEQMVVEARISAADRAIKQRGLQEADRLLQQAGVELTRLLVQHRQFVQQGNLTEQNYRAFQSEAEPIYVELRQAEAFMKEIARGL